MQTHSAGLGGFPLLLLLATTSPLISAISNIHLCTYQLRDVLRGALEPSACFLLPSEVNQAD